MCTGTISNLQSARKCGDASLDTKCVCMCTIMAHLSERTEFQVTAFNAHPSDAPIGTPSARGTSSRCYLRRPPAHTHTHTHHVGQMRADPDHADPS